MIGPCNCPIKGVQLNCPITTLQINYSTIQQSMHQSRYNCYDFETNRRAEN